MKGGKKPPMILSLQELCLDRQLMILGSPIGAGKRTIHAKPWDAVMKNRLFSPGQGDLLRGKRFLGLCGSMGLFNLGHNRSAQLPFFETKSWRRVLDPCGDTVGMLHRSKWPPTRRLYWARRGTWMGCSGFTGHHTSFSTGHTTLFLPQGCSVGLVGQPGHGAASTQPKGTAVHSQSLEAEASGLGSCKQRQASRPEHLGKPRGHGPVWLQPGPSGPWQGQIYIFTGLPSSSTTAGLKKSLHFNPRSHC